MWLSDQHWTLSPAYDLLNVKLILPKDQEDTALLFGGTKMNFNKGYFDRFGNALNQNEKQINAVYKRLNKWLPKALELINISFLKDEHKMTYKELIVQRIKHFTTDNADQKVSGKVKICENPW